MNIKTLIETVDKLAKPISEAAAPKSPELLALLKQEKLLKKQLAQIQSEIIKVKDEEALQAKRDFGPVSNANKELSQLWRKHYDTMEEVYDAESDSPKYMRLDKLLKKIYEKVASKYGGQMAEDMYKHTEMLMKVKGPKGRDAARQFRADHDVSDEFFDPNDDFY